MNEFVSSKALSFHGLDIRGLRRRLGMTQMDLADRLNVDQGTVSRWERGLETPRPSTYSAMRDILLKAEDYRFLLRQLSIIRNNLQPAVFVDRRHRLKLFSGKATDHYRSRHGIELNKYLGWEFERFADYLNISSVWHELKGPFEYKDELLLIRAVHNVRGAGHVTHYEPILEDGELKGWSGIRVETFSFPVNYDVGLESLDIIHADSPDQMVNLFCGSLVPSS